MVCPRGGVAAPATTVSSGWLRLQTRLQPWERGWEQHDSVNGIVEEIHYLGRTPDIATVVDLSERLLVVQ